MLNVPTNYAEAVKGDNAEKWKHAMDEEMNSLRNNNTFDITELPEDKTVVGGNGFIQSKEPPRTQSIEQDMLQRVIAR